MSVWRGRMTWACAVYVCRGRVPWTCAVNVCRERVHWTCAVRVCGVPGPWTCLLDVGGCSVAFFSSVIVIFDILAYISSSPIHLLRRTLL